MGLTTLPRKKHLVTETKMSKTIVTRPIADPSHPNYLGGSMITPDESRKEVRIVREGLLGPKNEIRLGAWNV